MYISGYPVSKYKTSKVVRVGKGGSPGEIHASTLDLYAIHDREIGFQKFNRDARAHVGFAYEKRVQDVHGTEMNAVGLRGMSGAPIWHIDSNLPRLVGVFTEFKEKEGRVGIGAKITGLLMLLNESFA